jgi:hypothetical protein
MCRTSLLDYLLALTCYEGHHDFLAPRRSFLEYSIKGFDHAVLQFNPESNKTRSNNCITYQNHLHTCGNPLQN